MTENLSDSLENGFDFGDKYIINLLESLFLKFNSGDRSALFVVIALCARYQAVIPDWAADEILCIEQSIENGEVRDFNVAFGWASNNLASRKKKAKLEKFKSPVLAKMQELRAEGRSLNADDLLQETADCLNISRREVEDIYKMHGKFIKNMPKNISGTGAIIGFVQIQIPRSRRYGRSIFKD